MFRGDRTPKPVFRRTIKRATSGRLKTAEDIQATRLHRDCDALSWLLKLPDPLLRGFRQRLHQHHRQPFLYRGDGALG
jgi:hypothetical protein